LKHDQRQKGAGLREALSIQHSDSAFSAQHSAFSQIRSKKNQAVLPLRYDQPGSHEGDLA
jgi:hypothetical protein